MAPITYSTIVQFVRNFLCVLKSLLPLYTGTGSASLNAFLFRTIPKDMQSYIVKNLPESYDKLPYNLIYKPKKKVRQFLFNAITRNKRLGALLEVVVAKTLYIEYLIAPTQFLAFIYNVQSGYTNVRKGIVQIRRYNQWLYTIDRLAVTGYDRRGTVGPEIYTICRNAILGDRQEARVGTFVGVLELVFGVAFLFLVANTLHINTQNWPKPCIDALLAMEIGLTYILLLMWRGYKRKLQLRNEHLTLSRTFLKSMPLLDPRETKVTRIFEYIFHNNARAAYSHGMHETLLLVCGEQYSPRWRSPDVRLKDITEGLVDSELKLMKDAFEATLMPMNDKVLSDWKYTNISDALKGSSDGYASAAPLDLLYFALNVIAGYGYMIGIVCFYFPPDVKTGLTPLWCRAVMFGLSYSDADWYGNLAGDAAWTLEPLLIIGTELYARWRARKAQAGSRPEEEIVRISNKKDD